jgi:hypothetical protein
MWMEKEQLLPLVYLLAIINTQNFWQSELTYLKNSFNKHNSSFLRLNKKYLCKISEDCIGKES